MTADLDIYRTAKFLVNRHGGDAPIHAALRADAMLVAGDPVGYRVWKRIRRPVRALQGVKPGTPVH